MEKPRKKIQYMKELLPEEQKWLAKAVITVVLADNMVEEKQVQFMKKLSKVFMDEEEKETINEIARLLREKELPTIGELQVDDPERLIYMLNTLVSSIFANETKTTNMQNSIITTTTAITGGLTKAFVLGFSLTSFASAK